MRKADEKTTMPWFFNHELAGGDEGHKRVDELASSLLLTFLDVLPPRPGHLAGELFSCGKFFKMHSLLSGSLPQKVDNLVCTTPGVAYGPPPH